MQIEMTGRDDRLSPWKYAIGGYPGAGKTMLASTAPDPLFVFFRENPRIKSIADRFIPHVKVLNDDTATVLEKMQALTVHLSLNDTEYKTLVIDTGDELQLAMKEARRIRNGGEFGLPDWGWLGDAYRELMTSLIDLPMRVIVLFHVKSTQEGDDGQMVRELMLQGSASDEAAGWFDVVGALDTYEAADGEGDLYTKRVMLTHSSRLYPWVKDHSGNLPRRVELSDNFVGDISTIEDLLNSTEIQAEHAVIGEVEEPSSASGPVITPEELEEAKNSTTETISVALDAVAEVLEVAEVTDEIPEPSPEEQSEEATVEVPPVEEVEDTQPSLLDEASDEQPETTEDEAVAFIPPKTCEVCGEVAPDDVATITKIRWKQVLCQEHLKEKLRAE